MKKNEPFTSFPKKIFSTVGNIGIAGDRIVNLQKNNPFQTGGGLPAGYGPQTLNICVNGVAGQMTVIGTAPVAG